VSADDQVPAAEAPGSTASDRSLGGPDELAALRAENARLRARVADLEARAGAARDDAEALADLKLRYEHVLEATRDGVFDWDIETGRLTHSPRCRELYGFEPATVEDVIERFLSAVHPDDRDGFVAAVEAHRERDVPFDTEYRLMHPEGDYRWLRSRGVSLRDAAGRAVRMVGAVSDVTSEKRLLKLTEEASRAAGIGHWEVDVIRGELFHSPETVRIHGLEPGPAALSVEEAISFYPSEERQRIRDLLARATELSEPFELEFDFLSADGKSKRVYVVGRPEHVDGRPVTIYGAIQDITDRWRLEQQLRQSQRLESVGRLAGGVAHDFNNLLTAIITYGHLVAEELPEGGKAREDVGAILSAAQRAEGLTQQLLAFARKQVVAPRLLVLPDAVDEIARLLRTVLGEDIRLAVHHRSEGRPVIRIDPSQLDQVLVNLSVNARDAMPTGGQLTLETDSVTLSAPARWGGVELAPGSYAVLTIADTGHGMDEDTLSRVFDPFFTTKPESQGTGLGLATVHGIVAQSEGGILVESAMGEGTRFRILWPRMDGAPQVRSSRPPEPDVPGNATILVVEDDPLVRDLTARVLRRRGYRVLAAGNATCAKDLMKAHGDEVALLVADVVMPGASGRELADELVERWPGLLVLYVSGYTEDTVLRHGVERDGVPFLVKPFTPSQLCAKVADLLAAHGGTPNEAPPG